VTDPFSDHYWREEFQVTGADLERIAAHIRKTGQARDLTALARRVVRGRLRHGPETSPAVVTAPGADSSVRLWDAEKEWNVGDQAIVPAQVRRGDLWPRAPFIGEVVEILSDENKVEIRVDALAKSIKYSTKPDAEKGESYERWRRIIEDLVAPLRGTRDLETQIDYVMFQYEYVSSGLLSALKADKRFVRLAGRWFLHELALYPTEAQLTGLAWAMVPLEEPQPTADLVPLVQPPLVEGDPGLFGLYLAMRDRHDLFANADPGKRPCWVLAGPPTGTFTPCCAAYDPDTYEILCLPSEPVPPEVVNRLWDLGLLRAVL
jgi:hypothetical protein